MRANVYVLLI